MRVLTQLLVVLAGIVLSGCATDPEFASSSTQAGGAGKANDIVGQWYSRSQHRGVVAADLEFIMNLRPDGTGDVKSGGHGSAFMQGKLQTGHVVTMKWSYAGAGVWKFSQQGGGVGTITTGTMKIANGRLLKATKIIVPTAPIIGWGLMNNNEVFVRANDANALREEALRDNTSR